MKLVLKPSTFIWTDDHMVLLYNTHNSSSLYYPLCPEIKAICSQWQRIDNLYVAKCNSELMGEQAREFVNDIVSKEMGEIDDDQSKCLSFPPLLSVYNSPERLHKHGVDYKAIDVLENLLNLKIALGGISEGINWWRQMEPMTSGSFSLDVVKLSSFVNRCDLFSLANVDVYVSIWDRAQIESIAFIFSRIKERVRFFYFDTDPGFNNDILDRLIDLGFKIIQVCSPDSKLKKADWVGGRDYRLLVRSEEDVKYWENLLGDDTDVKYDYKPIADHNLEFFRKNVFLSKEEILSQKLTKKDIFRHQALNVNQFGTFYIFPDGTIHPAADAPAIGTLEDPVHQTIIRELEENYAWRQTRSLMEPCKNCIFHDLCPSPSVYERILGVPGCTYWKE